jgi:hypothetical protein
VAAASYRGCVEVEIFNAEMWSAPPDKTTRMVRERFAFVQGPAVPRGYPGGP